MQCPACHSELTMSERQGIEIDYCPQCRGIWLDRGELDKIIDRAASSEPAASAQGAPGGWTQSATQAAQKLASGWDQRGHDHDSRRYAEHGHYDRKPRKHW